jgi:hypothetical protein
MYSFQADYQTSYQPPAPLQVEGELPETTSTAVNGADNQPIPERPDHRPSSQQQMKRLSLQLSASLHREAKLAALEDEETLNSMVISLLKQYLAHRRKMIKSAMQKRT